MKEDERIEDIKNRSTKDEVEEKRKTKKRARKTIVEEKKRTRLTKGGLLGGRVEHQ